MAIAERRCSGAVESVVTGRCLTVHTEVASWAINALSLILSHLVEAHGAVKLELGAKWAVQTLDTASNLASSRG